MYHFLPLRPRHPGCTVHQKVISILSGTGFSARSPLFAVMEVYVYYRCQYHAPIGILTIASDGNNITGLWLEGQTHFAAGHRNPCDSPELPIFQNARDWLDRYFSGQMPSCSELPLSPNGTPFQQKIWEILMQIPYGQTMTYGQIAKTLGSTMSAQAVGGAVGRNPISVIIPCHRVLGAGKKLTGYAGGIERKQWLLHHECIHAVRNEY